MSRITQPICMTCGIIMRCKKNEFVVKDPRVGDFKSTYWSGDLYQCPKCGVEVVVGTGMGIDHDTAVKGGIANEAREFAYSVPAVKNQCDGCINNWPLKDGIHYNGAVVAMCCTRSRYQPSTSEIIEDFKDWSGGFAPSECDEAKVAQYMELACLWPELTIQQLFEAEPGGTTGT